MKTEHTQTPYEVVEPLPATLRLVRTHPDEKTRKALLELVAHDHNDFGYEEGMFFAAEEGSRRARIAHACVDRYNRQPALLDALTDAEQFILDSGANGASQLLAKIRASLQSPAPETK